MSANVGDRSAGLARKQEIAALKTRETGIKSERDTIKDAMGGYGAGGVSLASGSPLNFYTSEMRRLIRQLDDIQKQQEDLSSDWPGNPWMQKKIKEGKKEF